MFSKPRLFLLLGVLILTWTAGVKGEPKEVTTTYYSKEYLYYLDESVSLGTSVPAADRVKPSETKVSINSLSVTLTAAPVGIREIPEGRFECQEVTYIVPAHRIQVLGARLEGPGFFAETAPDPNGSGNVEVLVGWNMEGQRADKDIGLNYTFSHDGIEVVSSSTSSSSSGKKYGWTMKLVLRNKTDQPYTLPKEFFRDLPPLEEWPVVVIPPANAKS